MGLMQKIAGRIMVSSVAGPDRVRCLPLAGL